MLGHRRGDYLSLLNWNRFHVAMEIVANGLSNMRMLRRFCSLKHTAMKFVDI